ncbi:MAG: hypothetical protein O7D34_03055 [Ignavibacteria bacterium]|nr:hypothetical protein [Ignavibacteria bacterium]
MAASHGQDQTGMVPDPNKGVFALAINHQNPQIMYGATAGSQSGALYKSTDGGRYWSFGGVIYDWNTNVIIVDPIHPDIVYAGTDGFGGVFKSVDAGMSWDSVLWDFGGSIYDMTIDKINSERVYALITTGQGVARTSDGGINWTISQIGDSSITIQGLWSLSQETGMKCL